MNSFPQVASLIALISSLGLTIFVASRNLRSRVNLAFLLWGVAVSLWNFGTFMKYSVLLEDNEANQALVRPWLTVLHLGTIFLPVTSLQLSLLVAQIRRPRLLAALYVATVAIAFTLFGGHYFIRPELRGGNWFAVAGPGMTAYLVLYGCVSPATIVVLFMRQRKVPKLHQMRLRFLIVGLFVLLLTGTNDLMLVKGMATYPFTAIAVVPLANLGAIIYVILTGYSVIQHQLLNIHVTFSRIAANLIRLSFLGIFAGVLVFAVDVVVPHVLSPVGSLVCIGIVLASGLFASLAFPRLFARGDEILERRILGDRFEYHDHIRDFIGTMHRYTDLEPMLAQLDELLTRSVGVRSYRLVTLHEVQHRFITLGAWPAAGASDRELRFDSPIFRYFKDHHETHLAANLAYLIPGGSAEEGDAMKELQEFGAEFCFPLFSGTDPVGALMVGEKANGEPFTSHDLFLLTDLAKNLAITFNQFRLKNRLLQQEEMELMGRMSRGLAHDLNNLVTPVFTYLQILREMKGKSEDPDDLLPVALRNMQTIQAYIRTALFFSTTLKPNVALTSLDGVIRKSVQLADPKLKSKQMKVELELMDHAEAEMDEVLIQRVLDNLISNAVDASNPGGQLKLRLTQLARTESTRDWFRMEVVDQGSGISKENLKRIFTPYFTTKDKGDSNRGFGLGLAICRKIVHLHSGNLNVISEERKGTTIQFDLPSVQPSDKPTADVSLQ
ncbi:MAG: hypothetical protein HY301_19825 [Verrucomicrobia bacterium]|nr:hypothetical protein [Verrucomicrobiota bacterium]